MVFFQPQKPKGATLLLVSQLQIFKIALITFSPYAPRYKGALRIQKENKMRQRNETQKKGKKPTDKKCGGMVSFSERQKEQCGLKYSSQSKGLRHQRSALFFENKTNAKES